MRDEVAHWLGVDDRDSDGKVFFAYSQKRASHWCVLIATESLS